MVTALLHDIGKLADTHDYDGDHALAGGGLARRWGLPESVASAIERHHDADADGDAAYIQLADMLAHYAHGTPVSPNELLDCARAIGLGPAELRAIVYELPYPQKPSPRAVDRCPLSARELEVLKRLAEGKVYKQIALELHLSASTVRTHLHNIYGKLGTIDRAQAVLVATARGWLEYPVRPTDRRRDRHAIGFESLSYAGAERSAA
jgi:DNA-binding CsgD family transcriptional regulator